MADGVRLSDEQRLDWLRLIRSDNIGPESWSGTAAHWYRRYNVRYVEPPAPEKGDVLL